MSLAYWCDRTDGPDVVVAAAGSVCLDFHCFMGLEKDRYVASCLRVVRSLFWFFFFSIFISIFISVSCSFQSPCQLQRQFQPRLHLHLLLLLLVLKNVSAILTMKLDCIVAAVVQDTIQVTPVHSMPCSTYRTCLYCSTDSIAWVTR